MGRESVNLWDKLIDSGIEAVSGGGEGEMSTDGLNESIGAYDNSPDIGVSIDTSGDTGMSSNEMYKRQAQEEMATVSGGERQEGRDYTESAKGVASDSAANIKAASIEKVLPALWAGTGDLVSGVGDMVVMAKAMMGGDLGSQSPWSIPDMISNSLYGVAGKMKEEGHIYVAPELGELTFDNLFASPDAFLEFVATDGARSMPFTFGMMYSAGAMGSSLGKKALLKGIKKTASKGHKFAKKGAVSGKIFGKQGLAYTDELGQLVLSDAGAKTGMFIGSAISTNLMTSMMNGGEAVNTALAMGLDEESARQAGLDTFIDNSKWVLIDGLQYGLSFGGMSPKILGKFRNKLKIANSKRMQGRAAALAIEGMSPKQIRKRIGREVFANNAMRAISTLPQVAGVAGLEGMTETFQESYEEWTSRKNIREQLGLETEDYMTFYNSDGNFKTKAVSFISGALFGGVGASINTMAERKHLLANKEELLESALDKDMEAREVRDNYVSDIIQDAVMMGEDAVVETMNIVAGLQKEGKIDEVQANAYRASVKNFTETWDNVHSDLYTPAGVRALFKNEVAKGMTQAQIQEKKESFEEQRETLKKNIKDEAVLEEKLAELNAHENEILSNMENDVLNRDKYAEALTKLQDPKLVSELAEANEAIAEFEEILSSEEKLNELSEEEKENIKDEYGAAISVRGSLLKKIDEKVITLSEEEYAAFTKHGNEAAKSNLDKLRGKLKGGKEEATSLFSKIRGKVKSYFTSSKEEETSEDVEVTVDEDVETTETPEEAEAKNSEESTEPEVVKESEEERKSKIKTVKPDSSYEFEFVEDAEIVEDGIDGVSSGSRAARFEGAKKILQDTLETVKDKVGVKSKAEDNFDPSRHDFLHDASFNFGAINSMRLEAKKIGVDTAVLSKVQKQGVQVKGLAVGSTVLLRHMPEMEETLMHEYGHIWYSMFVNSDEELKGKISRMMVNSKSVEKMMDGEYLLDTKFDLETDEGAVRVTLGEFISHIKNTDPEAHQALEGKSWKEQASFFVGEGYLKTVPALEQDILIEEAFVDSIANQLQGNITLSFESTKHQKEFGKNYGLFKRMILKAVGQKDAIDAINKTHPTLSNFDNMSEIASIVENSILSKEFVGGVSVNSMASRFPDAWASDVAVEVENFMEGKDFKDSYHGDIKDAVNKGADHITNRLWSGIDKHSRKVLSLSTLMKETKSMLRDAIVKQVMKKDFAEVTNNTSIDGKMRVSDVEAMFEGVFEEFKFEGEEVLSTSKIRSVVNYVVNSAAIARKEGRLDMLQDNMLAEEDLAYQQLYKRRIMGALVGIAKKSDSKSSFLENVEIMKDKSSMLKSFMEFLENDKGADFTQAVIRDAYTESKRLGIEKYRHGNVYVNAKGQRVYSNNETRSAADSVAIESLIKERTEDVGYFKSKEDVKNPKERKYISSVINAAKKHLEDNPSARLSNKDALEIIKTVYVSQAGVSRNAAILDKIAWDFIADDVIVNDDKGRPMNLGAYVSGVLRNEKAVTSSYLGLSSVNPKKFADAIKASVSASRMYNFIEMSENVEGNQTAILRNPSFTQRRANALPQMSNEQRNTMFGEDNLINRMMRGGWSPQIYTDGGLKTEHGAANFDKLDTKALLFNKVMSFNSGLSRFREQAKNTKGGVDAIKGYSYYPQSIGRYADSKTSHVLDMPVFIGKNLQREMRVLKNMKHQFKDGSSVHSEIITNADGTLSFAGEKARVAKMVEMVNENIEAYKGFEGFKDLITGNKLNAKGVETLRLLDSNNIINSTHAQSVFIGSHSNFKSAKDYDKRGKGASGRFVSLGDAYSGIEFITFEDVYKKVDEDGTAVFKSESEVISQYGSTEGWHNQTDAGAYITTTQMDKIRESLKGSMNVGSVLKGMFFGSDNRVGKDANQFIGGETAYSKMAVQTLDDAYVSHSPYLQKMREIVEAREKYLTQINGGKNALVMANHSSAAKAFNYTGSDEKGRARKLVKGKWEVINNTHNLSEYVNGKDVSEVGHIQNSLYTPLNQFKGLDPNNFGVQLELDSDKQKEVKIPIQLLSYALNNLSTSNDVAAKDIINKLLEDSAASSKGLLSKLQADGLIKDKVNLEQFNNELVKMMDASFIGDFKYDLFNSGLININHPAGNRVASNIAAKKISSSLIRNITKGEIGYSSPDVGMNLKSLAKKGNVAYSEAIVPASLKAQGYRVGDVFIGTRIPADAKSKTRVFVIKAFHEDTKGYANTKVTIPAEDHTIMGSDNDGDALFMNFPKNRMSLDDVVNTKLQAKDGLFKSMIDVFGDASRVEEISAAMDFDNLISETTDYLTEVYGEAEATQDYNTILSDLNSFNNNLPAKKMVGVAASSMRVMNYMAANEVELAFDVTIKDKDGSTTLSKFEDEESTKDGVYDSSPVRVAKLLNIILDNAKYQVMDLIGINGDNASIFLMLARKFDLKHVATIMKSPAAIAYAKGMSGSSVSSPYQKRNALDMALKAGKSKSTSGSLIKLMEDTKTDVSIDIENINSPMEQTRIAMMMYMMEQTSNEFSHISKTINMHKSPPRTAYEAQVIKDGFNDLGKGWLKNMDGLKNDQFVKRNIEAIDKIITYQKNVDMRATKEATTIVDKIKSLISNEDKLNRKGEVGNDTVINNILDEYVLDVLSLTHPMFNKAAKLRNKLGNKAAIESVMESIKVESEKGKRVNELFNELFSIGNGRLLASDLTSNKDSNPEITSRVRELSREVKNLSPELFDLIAQYDYLANGLGYKNDSLINIYPEEFFKSQKLGDEKGVSEILEEEFYRRRRGKVNDSHVESFAKSFVLNNPQLLDYTSARSLNKVGDYFEINDYISDNYSILDKLKKDEVHYIRAKSNGKDVILRYVPIGGDVIKNVPSSRKLRALVDNNAKYEEVTMSDNDFTPPSPPTKPKPPKKEEIKLKGIKVQDLSNFLKKNRQSGKASHFKSKGGSSDFYSGKFKALSFSEWLKAKGVYSKKNLSRKDFKSTYDTYIKAFGASKSFMKEFVVNNLIANKQLFPDEKLQELAVDFGKMDKLGSSEAVNEINLELANRAYNTQKALLKGKGLKESDISTTRKWLGSNDMTSKRPEIQKLIVEMEKEMLVYDRRLFGYKKEVQRLRNNLIKSSGISLIERQRLTFSGKLNDRLFGKMYTRETAKDGQTHGDLKLKSPEEFKALNPSKAEIEFYNYFKKITKEFAGHSKKDLGKRLKDGYIPHINMGLMESLATRGAYGLYAATTKSSSDINNVIVKGTSVEGKPVSMRFGDWKNIYKKDTDGLTLKSGRKIREFHKLRKKAEKFYKAGTHEDGSVLSMTANEMNGMQDGNLMNRFSSSRGVNNSYFATTDLSHILGEYVRSSLFVYGDGKFKGFQKMKPLVDGIIEMNKRLGNDNAVEYVDKVWKQAVLQGKKQGVNKVFDKTVDGFVTWTLYSVLGLGFKSAVANTVIGKYNEIRARGFKSWVKGEKRFLTNFRKSRAIIHNYMKVNEVAFEYTKVGFDTSWFGKILFFPMIFSEEYIQGTAFVGALTDEQWANFNDDGTMKDDSKFKEENATKLINDVRRQQGFGYTSHDQMMITQYSMGRALMQFKRYIPAFITERLGEEDVDRFGEHTIGSYRAAGRFMRNVYAKRMGVKEVQAAYNKLPKHEKEAIDRYNRGMSLVMMGSLALVFLAGMGMDDEDELYILVDGAVNDANMMFNVDKHMTHTFVPSSYNTLDNLKSALEQFAYDDRVKAHSPYVDMGGAKWKSTALNLMPAKNTVKDITKLVRGEN